MSSICIPVLNLNMTKVFNFLKSEVLNNFFNVIIFPFMFNLKVNIFSVFLILTYKQFTRIFLTFLLRIIIGSFFN